MSGQHKVAWLCEALLVSRSGYYDWKKRCHQPGPRHVENARLRERIREEFVRKSSDLWQSSTGSCSRLPWAA
jgi:hypothetical protein